MNLELQELLRADQDERIEHPEVGTEEYTALRRRDAARRKRLQEIVAADELEEPEDFYNAAWILNHGETVEEIWEAHALAKKALERGVRRARWLAAATFDRWL